MTDPTTDPTDALTALEQAADRATPGPWFQRDGRNGFAVWANISPTSSMQIAVTGWAATFDSANAAYIAAAGPDVVQALIARTRTAEAERDALQREAEPPVYGSDVLCEHCATVFCPHGERLHFDKDGCPQCSMDEPLEAEPPPWQPIETAPKMLKVLVTFVNALGNRRTTTACYYTAKALEMADDYADVGEYDDASGISYASEGWYEEHACGESDLDPITETLTHWMPLPTQPTEAPHA